LKNLTFVKTYLTSLAKYKINVTKVTKNLGDLDAREWNDFRSCFNNNQNFGKYAFHHITHGGDVKKSTFTWDQVQIELKDVVKNLLINASYPTVSTCVCKTSNVSCDDKVLGHPKGKPSVRELLQWNYRGQSLTRVLLLSKPKSISVLGQLNHDYCWFNPLCIEELVQRIDESDIHADECASYIPNSGKLQGVYAFEEDSERNERNERKGLWLCTHIPGLLTPTKWGEIGGFGEVMKLARRSGAKNVYRIDWDASSTKRKIWRIVESGTPSWVQEVVDVQAEFGDIVKHLLPQSGLVLFIPAAKTKDARECWEVSID
ncbi:MAG: hypothetical protein ORN54_00285, partial [Cyclobacteriaceae bacterium]|nr:hypothetical protein [Cyclobacteriaceae bacterium]